ncbi:MAG TPA: hemerythrin domain-containing protein [Pyrinomonadaceae bacterium]|nr:hemerythrin domain-containing protein [Pyrinomonadaceae bacterium]
MDAFKLLKTDHKKVAQLFKEIEAASAASSKSQLFSQLKSELDLHAHIEEKYLYPALENKKESREITLEAYEEHNVVKDLLAELATRSPDDEWDAKLTVLKENVEHHVEEEEGELFGKAKSVLSKEQIERIGVEMEAEKAAQNGGNTRTPKSSTKSAKKAAAKTPASKRESPGVLTRLAKLVGLGGDDSSPAKKTSTRRPAKKAAKKAASSTKGTRKAAATTTRSSLARKSAKRQPAKKKAVSRTSTKTKKSASKKK